jgi:CxxC motif-containing protein (DUF1111 family)
LSPKSPKDAELQVPAYTDLKLHDISEINQETTIETLDMNWPVWAPKFSAGNRRFLTRRLWGVANSGPYFHHGLFNTLREAVIAHSGEAIASRNLFSQANAADRDDLIEFLKSLQVLPAGTASLVVDENLKPKKWVIQGQKD